MLHVERPLLPPPPAPPNDLAPLFVNLPQPILTEADLERALVQDEAA